MEGVRSAGSGGLPFVLVMQAADLRDRDDAAVARRRDPSRDWRVFVQRQVGAGLFVIRAIEMHEPRSPVALKTMT